MLSGRDRSVPSSSNFIESPPRKKKKSGKCKEISAVVKTFTTDDSSNLLGNSSITVKKHKKHHRHTPDLLANQREASHTIANRHEAYNRSVYADGLNELQGLEKCNDAGQNSSMTTLGELSECEDITLCKDFTDEDTTVLVSRKHKKRHKRKREIGVNDPLCGDVSSLTGRHMKHHKKKDATQEQFSVTASVTDECSDSLYSLPLMKHIKRDKNKKLLSDTTSCEQIFPNMNDDSKSASSSKKHRKRKVSGSINPLKQTSLMTDFFGNTSDNTCSVTTTTSDSNQLNIGVIIDSLQSKDIVCGTGSITNSKNKSKHKKRESSDGTFFTCTQSDHKKFPSLQIDRSDGDPSHFAKSGSTDINQSSNIICTEDTSGSSRVFHHKHHKKGKKLHPDEHDGNYSCEQSSTTLSVERDKSIDTNKNDASSFLHPKIHKKSKKKKTSKHDDNEHVTMVTDDSCFDGKGNDDLQIVCIEDTSGSSRVFHHKHHKKGKKLHPDEHDGNYSCEQSSTTLSVERDKSIDTNKNDASSFLHPKIHKKSKKKKRSKHDDNEHVTMVTDDSCFDGKGNDDLQIVCIEDTSGSSRVFHHKHHKKGKKLHPDEHDGNYSCEQSSTTLSVERDKSIDTNKNDASSFLHPKIHKKSKKKKRSKHDDNEHVTMVTDDSCFDGKGNDDLPIMDMHIDVGSSQNANKGDPSNLLHHKSHKKTKKQKKITLKNSEHGDSDCEIDNKYEHQRDAESMQLQDVCDTVCSTNEPKPVFDKKCSDVMLQTHTKIKDYFIKLKFHSRKHFGKFPYVVEDEPVFCNDDRISKRSLRTGNEKECFVSSEIRTIECQNQEDGTGTMPSKTCSDEDTLDSGLDLYIPDNEISGSEFCGSSQTSDDESDDLLAKSTPRKKASRERATNESIKRSKKAITACQNEILARASSFGQIQEKMTPTRKSTVSTENTGSCHSDLFVSSEICAIIHNVNRHSGRLRQQDLERLKQLDVVVRTGKFAKEEDDRLLHNLTIFWNTYSECAGAVTLDGLVHPEKELDPDRQKEIRSFIRKHNFYIEVAKTLNRPMYACYRRAQLIYNRPNVDHMQMWSQDDTKTLIELHKNFDGDWPRIATKMDRTETVVKTRWTNIKSGDVTPGRTIWTEDEAERLRSVMRQVLGMDDLTNIEKHVPWSKIASHMPGRTATRLREKWVNCLAWKEAHKEDGEIRQKWSSSNDCCLLQRINQQNVQDERDIDWIDMMKFFDNPSTAFLELKWKKLKTKVPNHHLKSLAEICDHLEVTR